MALFAQAKALQHFLDARGDLGRRHVEQLGVQHQVLQHRQLAVQRKALRHIAHAAARGDVAGVHLVAEQRGPAFAGRHQAGQHLHRGGFAAAVGAEKAEDLAAPDPEVDMVHGDEVAKTHGQVLRLDGDVVRSGLQRGNHHGGVAAFLVFRQQGDEGRLQRFGLGARQQFRRRARGQDLAIVHSHQPVKALGLVHIGRGHQHAHLRASGADAVDQVPELRARQRVHAGGGLVQDQQVGVVYQRAAQAELLLHAAREFARRAAQEFLQARALRQVIDAPAAFSGVVPEQARKELQVLFDRQGGIEVLAQALRHIGNAWAHGIAVPAAGHVAAQHEHLPVLHGTCARHQRQQTGFADAVRANEAHHAARGDVQRDAAQRFGLAVVLAHIMQGDDRG